MTLSPPLVAVLGYHKIGVSPEDWQSWYYVPQPALELHVSLLLEGGWQPLQPDRLIAAFDDPGSLPERSFLITFDDAYRSLRTEALPWLVENGIPAVVFVPTAYVGGLNEFDRDTEPEEPILGWGDLGELRSHGVWIQSHGVTHGAFSDLTTPERIAELRDSKSTIEQHAGGRVNLFSYPYGDSGPGGVPERQLRQAGYELAFGYGGGPFSLPGADRFLLPRIALGADSDLRAAIE